jgi:hypothetical protein
VLIDNPVSVSARLEGKRRYLGRRGSLQTGCHAERKTGIRK